MTKKDIREDSSEMSSIDVAKFNREKAREKLSLFFGDRVKEARSKKGDHQATAAPLLGVSPSALHTYEAGKQIPSVDFLLNLCERYNVSADYLLGLSQENISSKEQVWEMLSMLLDSNVGVFEVNVHFQLPRTRIDSRGGKDVGVYPEEKPIIFVVLNGEELSEHLYDLRQVGDLVASSGLSEKVKRELFENRKAQLSGNKNPDYEPLPDDLTSSLERHLRYVYEEKRPITFVSVPLPSMLSDDIDTTPIMTDLRPFDPQNPDLEQDDKGIEKTDDDKKPN